MDEHQNIVIEVNSTHKYVEEKEELKSEVKLSPCKNVNLSKKFLQSALSK